MPDLLLIGGAAISAAVLAAAGPVALSRLPEPEDPDEGKTPYADLGRTRGLGGGLAAFAALYAGVAAALLPEPALIGVWILLGAFGGLLAFVDWHTHLLPRYLVWPLFVLVWIALGIGAAIARDADIVLHALYGNLAVFAAFWLLYLVAGVFFRGGFGYGDVRLSAALGAALGPFGIAPTFLGIYAGFALGAIVGVVRQRGRLRGQAPLAFGPFMILGAIGGLLV